MNKKFNQSIFMRAWRHTIFYKKYREYYLGEQKKCWGRENPDKTFYVIRPTSSTAGLMSIHNSVAWKIKYALEKGYIPVVDYKNYHNMYLSKEKKGKENAYEYYFCQPTEYDLEKISKSKNVRICDMFLDAGYRGIDDKESILFFHDLMNKYMKFNSQTSSVLKQNHERLFPKEKRILGVLGRGTDYVTLQPKQHAVVPDIELLLQTTERYFKEWQMDYIFLATEDESIYEAFKDKFKGLIISNDCQRYATNTDNKKLAELECNRKNDRFLRGLEYLTTIYLLSKCNSIITASVGGGLAAIRMNGCKYENTYIFNLGSYK